MKERELSTEAILLAIAVIVLVAFGLTQSPVSLSPATCSDSDRGVDTARKGTVCLGDNCVSDYCGERGSRTVIEHSCSPEGSVVSEETVCPHGCDSGACARAGQATECKTDDNCNSAETHNYCNNAGEACVRTLSYSCENAGTPESFCAPASEFSCTACAGGTNCVKGACVA